MRMAWDSKDPDLNTVIGTTLDNWANLVQSTLGSPSAKTVGMRFPTSWARFLAMSKLTVVEVKRSLCFPRSWVIPVNWNLLLRQLQDEHLLLALLVDKRLPGIGCDSFIRFTFWWDCAESFSLVQWFFLANTVIKQVLLLPSAETNQFKIPLGNSLFPLYRPGSRQVSLSGWNQAEILREPCHKAPFTFSWLKNINVQPTYLVCYLKKDSLISWLINSFIALFIFSKNILNRFS